MRGAGAGEALGLGLDHGLEGGGAEGTLLLQGGADGGQFVVADGFVQELPKTGVRVHFHSGLCFLGRPILAGPQRRPSWASMAARKRSLP